MKMMENSKIGIIITAAGSSRRIGGGIKKEFLPLKNGTVLSNCAIAFLKAHYESILGNNYILSNFVITCNENFRDESYKALFANSEMNMLFREKAVEPDFVTGGKSRQDSVFNALDFIKKSGNEPGIVLIHDGARPFISEKVILDVVQAVVDCGAGVPGITPTDTQKEIDKNGFIVRHLVRNNLVAVQTPQGFNFMELYKAHEKAQNISKNTNREFTDDTEIWGEFCGAVKSVPGDVNNIKITYPRDLEGL